MTLRLYAMFLCLLATCLALTGCRTLLSNTPVMPAEPRESRESKGEEKLPALQPLLIPQPTGEAAHYLEKLRGHTTGKGIFIFSPVMQSAADDPSFATGCARWLYLTLGGAKDLPQTPVWYQGQQLQLHLERHDLRLTPEEGKQGAALLGTTHYAVGTAEAGKITFQVHDRDGKTVGEPVVLAGNETQILAGLPEAANTLRQRLGLAKLRFHIPTETPKEIALVGHVPMVPALDLSETDAQDLHRLAMHSALGNLLYVGTTLRAERDPEPYDSRVKRLIEQAGDNPLVLAELALRDINSPELLKAMEKATQAGANTLSLAYCVLYLKHTPADEMRAMENIIRCAPNNSATWVRLERILSERASAIRKGRTMDLISGSEWQQLSSFYERAYVAACEATRLNPESGECYHVLMNAATFAGDRALANEALEQGVGRSMRRGGSADIIEAAMEFSDPKWGGSPDKKRQIAERAATLKAINLPRAVAVMEVLASYDYIPQAYQLAETILVEADRRLQLDPNDIVAHDARKAALGRTGKKKESLEEAKRCVALRPKDVFEQYQLALGYRNAHEYDAAITQLEKLIAFDPKYSTYQDLISDLLIKQKRMNEALPHSKIAVESDPDNIRSLNRLGYLLAISQQNDKALPYFQRAHRLSPSDAESMSNVGETLCRLGKVSEGRPLVEEAMRRSRSPEILANGNAVLKEFPAK
jgi:tetratricopeptide (TPR) repeat protein